MTSSPSTSSLPTWPRRPRRHRAFVATITAVALLGLASVALTAVVAATVVDVRRTRQSQTEAQDRQLLLAGAAGAAARARTWGDAPAPQSWEMTLPRALTDRGFRVKLSVAPAQAGVVEVRVEAAGPAARGGQTLCFARSAGEWKFKDTEER